jgi:hypothetical protein
LKASKEFELSREIEGEENKEEDFEDVEYELN